MQIAEGNLPPIASPFGRLGPLATQMSTGHLEPPDIKSGAVKGGLT